jgi:hypothetical protein
VGALQNFAKAIMRQRFDAMIVAPGHGVVID